MKDTLENRLKIVNNISNQITSILRILILSKRCSPIKKSPRQDTLIILGNGPSLLETINRSPKLFDSNPLMTVNFAMNSEFFTQFKPEYHVMIDPAIFVEEKHLSAFDKLSEIITWPFCLFVPTNVKNNPQWKTKEQRLRSNKLIDISYINTTRIDGPIPFIKRILYKGWGMPSPRNVLVAAIASALRLNFKEILLVGADHSWIKNLSVDENNNVLLNDKHFYDASSSKNNIVKTPKLSVVLNAISITMESYEKLNSIAKSQGCHILNITPGSFIDVFDRQRI